MRKFIGRLIVVLTLSGWACSASAALIYLADGATHVVDAANSFPADRIIVGELESGGAGIQPTTLQIFHGGVLDEFTVTYTSIANMYGGSVRYFSSVRDGIVNMYDGGVGYISASSSSSLNIFGGVVNGWISVSDNAVGNIYGGTLSADLRSTVDGVMNIYGDHFNHPLGAVSAPTGQLTGVLSDGTPIDVNFTREGWSLLGTINLIQAPIIPIPAAAWLFGSAMLGLAAVKRKKA